MIDSGWRYHNPVEVFCGPGRIKDLGRIVGKRKALLITTPGFARRGVTDSMKTILGDSWVDVFNGVQRNPTFESVREAYAIASSRDLDVIVALGGGSAIDTAKATAAMLTANEAGWLSEHLKAGRDFPEPFHPKPIMAIPTTAGSGSEVTMWATIWDVETKRKLSISHPSLYPKQAILDPELTLTLPRQETIYSGLDALSHAMESIWNKNHNPVSDIFAVKAIDLVFNYLPLVKDNLKDLHLRSKLIKASLLAGLAFSNTKTALAHSISYPLTAHFDLPHGLACSLPLVELMHLNGSKQFDRVKIMARALGVDEGLEPMLESLRRLFEGVGVSLRLGDYGVGLKEVEMISHSAVTPGRADNNIVDINKKELVALLERLV